MLRPVAAVLVVEDDRVIVRVFEINLRTAGYDVVTASTGAAATPAAIASAPATATARPA